MIKKAVGAHQSVFLRLRKSLVGSCMKMSESNLGFFLRAGGDVASWEEARVPTLRRHPAAGRSTALLRPPCTALGRSY